MYHFNEAWKQLHLHIIFQDFLIVFFWLILPLCSTLGTSETIVKLDTLKMIVAKFDSNWFSGFREEDFWKSLQTDDTGLQVMAIAKKYKDLYMYPTYIHDFFICILVLNVLSLHNPVTHIRTC
jgi:hypothetical protein